ncbi:Uncharacterised protein [Mycobacteroides abscessus subsp. abscessus]|nr:Uncharacterised protein [Mycobacteroides abscessus subsp. abscessus]
MEAFHLPCLPSCRRPYRLRPGRWYTKLRSTRVSSSLQVQRAGKHGSKTDVYRTAVHIQTAVRRMVRRRRIELKAESLRPNRLCSRRIRIMALTNL